MMLLYGILRGISALIRRVAEWHHSRTKAAYEMAEAAFRDLEAVCKADEVALGRPLDYAEQLKLLKAYERREIARSRWAEAARRVTSRKHVEGRVRSFSSMRLPYSFGLLDMAFIMRILDQLGLWPQADLNLLQQVFTYLSR